MKERRPGSTESVVERMYGQMGGVKRVTHIIDDVLGEKRSKTRLYAYADPDEPDQISFDLVRRLVRVTGATAPAEDLAALAGGVFVPSRPSKDSINQAIARSSKEFGEFIAQAFAARHNPGDPRSREKLLSELDDLIRAVVCVRVHLERGEPLDAPAETPAPNVTPIRTAVA